MKKAHLEKLANGKFLLLGEGEILIESGTERTCKKAVKRFGLTLVDRYDLNEYLRDTD